jgi:hypothetical protein
MFHVQNVLKLLDLITPVMIGEEQWTLTSCNFRQFLVVCIIACIVPFDLPRTSFSNVQPFSWETSLHTCTHTHVRMNVKMKTLNIAYSVLFPANSWPFPLICSMLWCHFNFWLQGWANCGQQARSGLWENENYM